MFPRAGAPGENDTRGIAPSHLLHRANSKRHGALDPPPATGQTLEPPLLVSLSPPRCLVSAQLVLDCPPLPTPSDIPSLLATFPPGGSPLSTRGQCNLHPASQLVIIGPGRAKATLRDWRPKPANMLFSLSGIMVVGQWPRRPGPDP